MKARATRLLEVIHGLQINTGETKHGLDVWFRGDFEGDEERLAVAEDCAISLGFEVGRIHGNVGWCPNSFCVTAPGWLVGQHLEANTIIDVRCSCGRPMPTKNILDGHQHRCSCDRIWVWLSALATYYLDELPEGQTWAQYIEVVAA